MQRGVMTVDTPQGPVQVNVQATSVVEQTFSCETRTYIESRDGDRVVYTTTIVVQVHITGDRLQLKSVTTSVQGDMTAAITKEWDMSVLDWRRYGLNAPRVSTQTTPGDLAVKCMMASASDHHGAAVTAAIDAVLRSMASGGQTGQAAAAGTVEVAVEEIAAGLAAGTSHVQQPPAILPGLPAVSGPLPSPMGSPEVAESARTEEETEEGLSFKRSKPASQGRAVTPVDTGRPKRVRKPGPSRFPDTSTDREIRAQRGQGVKKSPPAAKVQKKKKKTRLLTAEELRELLEEIDRELPEPEGEQGDQGPDRDTGGDGDGEGGAQAVV
jgi:hypothetical protein